MKKYLQYIFVLSGIFFLAASARAQSERVRFATAGQNTVTENKAPVSENKVSEKEQKNTAALRIRIDSLPPQAPSLNEANFKSDNSMTRDAEQRLQQREAMGTAEKIVESATDDAPVFPDLQVVATKEQSPENSLPVKEKRPEQLVRKSVSVAEDNATAGQPETEKVTLSPMKRKYLEGLVQDLEMEMQSGKDSSAAEIAARKKELEELKQLLAR